MSKKISQWGLNVLLAVYLNNTPVFEDLISRVTLQRDADGNVPDYQVDNLRAFIKVALRLTSASGDPISVKLRKALETMMDYGTKESSDNARAFLESPESQTPVIFTEMSDNSDYSRIGKALLPLLRNDGGRIDRGNINTINLLLQNVVQDFSA